MENSFFYGICEGYLVADEDNWNIFADSSEIFVPFGDVLVGDTRANVKHDDGALSSDTSINFN